MTKKALLILFLSLTYLCQSQLFTFKNINHKNGLSLSSVLSISQDKHGYIWIGTDGAGIQRFDGKNLKNIQLDDLDNEHHVTSIDPTNQGIYFSSKYAGFYLFHKKKLRLLIPKDEDFGERLLIKSYKNALFCVGSEKIKIYKNEKVKREYKFKKNIASIIQCLPIKHGLLLLTNEGAYYVSEHKICPIKEWLKENINPIAARYFDNKLELFEQDKNYFTTVFFSNQGEIFSKESKLLNENIKLKFNKVYAKKRVVFALDFNNNLYRFDNNKFKYIPLNSEKTKIEYENLFVDINDDFWASTRNSGVYKVTNEPFTKIEIHPVYQNPLISFIFNTDKGEIVVSNFDNVTHLGSFSQSDFQKYDLRIYMHTIFKGENLFATNKGIYVLKNGKFQIYDKIKSNKKIIFIYGHKNSLYFGADAEGLSEFRVDKNQISKIELSPQVSHVYTAQINFNQTKLYCGTNEGIVELNLYSKKSRIISKSIRSKGSYSGVSCKDSHGTLWFSYDKQIVGITEGEEMLLIDNPKYFKSTLFYTINSDLYGNLIIGTNEGITKLKIDYLGNVLNVAHYNSNNGFNGFETHMRSSYQNGKIIYIGTIEGLFAINTEKLEFLPNPPKPLIFQIKENNKYRINSDEDLIKVNYMVLNPKLAGIQYTYRLKGKTKEWSELSPKTEAYFSNLSDQEYIFQVRSTYDGINFSPIANYKIIKNTPFWKSKWFILFLILAIALANIIVLDRSKSFEISQIIENQNIEISNKIRSIILAFVFIANTGAHLFASYSEDNLPNLLVLNLIVSIILFSLFLLSIVKHRFIGINKYLLRLGLFVVVGQSFLASYLSAIHPMYVVIISLTTALTPFILNKITQVIIYSVFKLLISISIIFLVENAVYNEILFLIAIIVSISLSIFITYIRNESLQKLIFISGIINKGNIYAIAFDQHNKITYISENSQKKLNINPLNYLGKNISLLNKFVHQEFCSRKIDFGNEFQDDKKHVIPMKNPLKGEFWMEWSCKVFSKKIKVVFGQDISDRVKIESNYESLVESAKDLIYYVDVNGVFVYTNKQFQTILGYDENELIGRESLFIVTEKQKDFVRKFYTNQFQQRELNTYNEVLIRKKDGSEIWIGQNTTMLYTVGSSKFVKGFLCLARDITEKRNQQQLIENQNINITSSINYAQKIQHNLLPSKEKSDQIFKEFEVMYQAKDIVSGDFYWYEKIENKLMFVLSDCTGHGVPGAFMTLLGINLLNQIIKENKILEPGEILTQMDEKLVQILPREGNSSLRDGMEVIVLQVDLKTNEVFYACAGGKFVVKSKEDFIIKRGESKHIGDLAELNFTKYNTYTAEDESIDSYYFFTDGIQDQFSEITQKKFTLKRLLENLKKNQDASIAKQVSDMKNKYKKWKGNAEQTDDITFIGFKI